MKKIFLILFLLPLLFKAQQPYYLGWSPNGNQIGTNTSKLGTLDNRSLRFITNSTEKIKLDSLGWFRIRNTTSDGFFSIAPFIGANTLWMLHMGCFIRTNQNYSIGGDSTITVYNSPTDFVIKSRGTNMIFINSYAQTNQAYFEMFGLTTNSVSGTQKLMFLLGSNNIQFNTANAATSLKFQITGDTWSAVGASTRTNAITVQIDQPTAGTNMTFVNRRALFVNGNMIVNGTLNYVGNVTVTPTAQWQIGPRGLTSAGTAPFKLTVAGSTLMTTPEAGAFEVDANGDAYYTPVASRYKLATVLTNTATLDFINTLAATSSDLTITVTGAAVGDAVFLGTPASPNINSCLTSFVSAANTVTVRFNNYSAAAIDPASAVYKVVVNKN